MKILVTLNLLSENAKELLKNVGDVDYKTPSQKELLNVIESYDVVIIGLGLVFNSDVLQNAKRLKYIVTPTTGLDHIDLSVVEKKNIQVISLRGETDFLNTITGTAELAFVLLLNLFRKIIPSYKSVLEYKWDRDSFRGNNLSGNTLGVVGYGRLGKMMAKYGVSFGMNVLVFDPYQQIDNKYKGVDFSKLLSLSDAISIHIHLNKETEKLFDEKEFKKMKNTAYLINTSRGKIVNEEAVIKALKANSIAGYATDVLSKELEFSKTFDKNDLVEYAKHNDNCIIVPHIGGMTYESRQTTDLFIVNKFLGFISNK